MLDVINQFFEERRLDALATRLEPKPDQEPTLISMDPDGNGDMTVQEIVDELRNRGARAKVILDLYTPLKK